MIIDPQKPIYRVANMHSVPISICVRLALFQGARARLYVPPKTHADDGIDANQTRVVVVMF